MNAISGISVDDRYIRATGAVLALLCLWGLPLGAQAAGVASDQAALMAFYHAANGHLWEYNYNWGSDESLDSWHGVSTNAQGRVTRLDLANNDIYGEIPLALSGLGSLEVLDLSGNRLEMAIPSELGQLASLQALDLGGNTLEGEIPPELGQLASLEILDLSCNLLSGSVPPELLK